MPYIMPMNQKELYERCGYLAEKFRDWGGCTLDILAKDMLKSKEPEDKRIIRELGKDFFKTTLKEKGEEQDSCYCEESSSLTDNSFLKIDKPKKTKKNDVKWTRGIVLQAAKRNNYEMIIETGRV